jgi:hypothetical protein
MSGWQAGYVYNLEYYNTVQYGTVLYTKLCFQSLTFWTILKRKADYTVGYILGLKEAPLLTTLFPLIFVLVVG